MCAALYCASLSSDYAAKAGVEVLVAASQFNAPSETRIRIANTGRTLLDATTRGGLDVGGVGYLRLRKVRLLHARVRAWLRARHGRSGWPTSKFGLPINQEDQHGTLISFAVTVLDARSAMGVRVTQCEAADYLHLWAVTGWYLGTEGADLLDDTGRAIHPQQELAARLLGPTDESARLMCVLIADMSPTLPRIADGLPAALAQRMPGSTVAGYLDVRPQPAWQALVGVAATTIRMLGSMPCGRPLLSVASRRHGRKLMERSIDQDRYEAGAGPLRLGWRTF